MEELEEAKALAKNIAYSLPKEINIAALSHISMLPFKALSLRELLIHRASSLADGAVHLYEQNQAIPATVLTRAVFETTALLYTLYERTKTFLEKNNTAEFDEFLIASLVGSRIDQDEDMIQAINVMNHIKRMEVAIPGTLRTYEILCEYAHPNWSGLQGAYGKIDRNTFIMNLGTRPNRNKTGISALCGSLISFSHYYNELIDPIRELNTHFEDSY